MIEEIRKKSLRVRQTNHDIRNFINDSDFFLGYPVRCHDCNKNKKGVYIHKYSNFVSCNDCTKFIEQAI